MPVERVVVVRRDHFRDFDLRCRARLVPKALSARPPNWKPRKEKAAEIAADFMTTFYHVQVGALETQEFRTTPARFWLVCFSDTIGHD